MVATSSTSICNCDCLLHRPCLYKSSSISRQFVNYHRHSDKVILGAGFRRQIKGQFSTQAIRTVKGKTGFNSTSWDEKPFEMLPSGKKAYFDEQDIVTFLDPPKELIPFDPSSYNPASYLWKKIADIPEERRHRLLNLLKPKLISAAWQVAGARYEDTELAKKSSSNLLSVMEDSFSLEFWNCCKNGGLMPVTWINYFKKALFYKDGQVYGRFIGGSIIGTIAKSLSIPLYFTVKQVREVMATEEPCDQAYEFGDGQLDLLDYPKGFPTPVKHPWPFDDQVVIYVRHVGPGVMVGQAWQEGKELEQVPKKLCSEILMVKDSGVAEDDQ
ncbi:hypothetical protein Nepgr_015946 [Nepenthes gracilis]|uniref:Uncharacterized protein n=1 Tax=Nepenthes gracilis TaxID=150966 RepID=A0AAD3SLT1_NEPGR|nr:hypothetical protein Nepgr_015946 [Nepenthes gracilis]